MIRGRLISVTQTPISPPPAFTLTATTLYVEMDPIAGSTPAADLGCGVCGVVLTWPVAIIIETSVLLTSWELPREQFKYGIIKVGNFRKICGIIVMSRDTVL